MGSLDRELGTLGAWLLGIGVFLVLLDELLHLSVLGGSAEILVVAGVGLLVVNAFQVHRETPAASEHGPAPSSPNAGPQRGGSSPASHAEDAVVRCPDCRELNPIHASYCGACGTGVGGPGTPTSDPAGEG